MAADKILVTGGAGYIGSHVCIELMRNGFTPVIFDNFCNADVSIIERLSRIVRQPVQWRAGDVRNAAALQGLFAEHRFAGVIHLAALKSVTKSLAEPIDYVGTNVSGLVTLLSEMDRAGLRVLVFSSSATVYGAPDVLPIPEDAPRGYLNPYGFTKLMGEQILEQAAQAGAGWRFGVLRYFNPAGAHGSGLIGETAAAGTMNLFPQIARVALGEVASLTVFGNDFATRDGTGERDYIHIEDLARGHVLSLRALIEQNRNHVVNLGTGRGYTVLEVLSAYEAACGHRLPYQFLPRRPRDVDSCFADTRLAAEMLGFRAERGLADMCRSAWRSAEQLSGATVAGEARSACGAAPARQTTDPDALSAVALRH